jgi:antitoxin ParD1/3/4
LTDNQALLIQSLVESGRYQNASEVIREGLRLIERRETEDSVRLHALQVAAEVGLADLERGAFKEFSDAASFQQYLSGITNEVLSTHKQSL